MLTKATGVSAGQVLAAASAGHKHPCRVVHTVPGPHLFSNRTYTTTRYRSDVPEYSDEALAASDKGGKQHSWYGKSLANQRYQYHMMLSHVPTKQAPALDLNDKWDEAQECTGGAKTDTLVPGARYLSGRPNTCVCGGGGVQGEGGGKIHWRGYTHPF